MNAILAQTIDREFYLRSMHKQFSTNNPNLWQDILLGVGIVGGILALVWAVWWIQRWRRERGEIKPASLYRQVLSQTDLPASDLWRMWWLVKVVHIAHPTAVLISPELYDEAVRHYCDSSGWLGSRKRAAPQFKAIRARLFSD